MGIKVGARQVPFMKEETFSLQEQYFSSRLLWSGVWKAWLLYYTSIIGHRVAAGAGTVIGGLFLLGVADSYFFRLTRLNFLWIVSAITACCALGFSLSLITSIKRIRRTDFLRFVQLIDRVSGSEETFRNALDLCCLRLDSRAVSVTMAFLTVADAHLRWAGSARDVVYLRMIRPEIARAARSIGLVAVLLLLFVIFKGWSGFSLDRLWARYLRSVQVLRFEVSGRLLLIVDERDCAVLRGSPLRFRVRAVNGAPSELYGYWRGTGAFSQIALSEEGGGWYKGVCRVSEDGILWAQSGRRKSNEVPISAVDPPGLKYIQVVVKPPDYTGMALERYSDSRPIVLKILKGSELTVKITPTQPLSRAVWTVDSKSAKDVILPEGDPPLSLRCNVYDNMSVRVTMEDVHGIGSQQDVVRVILRRDQPPRISAVVQPSAISHGDSIPVAITAQDDFGLSALEVHQFFGGADKPIIAGPIRTLFLKGETDWSGEVPLRVASEQGHGYVWLRAKARDNDSVSGPKSAVSQWVKLRIVSESDPERSLEELMGRMGTLRERLVKHGNRSSIRDFSESVGEWVNAQQVSWLRERFERLRSLLQRGAITEALAEVERLQRQVERALREQRVARLAQEISALRALQEEVSNQVGRARRDEGLIAVQRDGRQRTEAAARELRREGSWWTEQGERLVGERIRAAVGALEHTPAVDAMAEVIQRLQRQDPVGAKAASDRALLDLRTAEQILTSPVRSPLTEAYRSERNILSRLLSATKEVLDQQRRVLKETEQNSLEPPDLKRLAGRERQLRQRWSQLQSDFDQAAVVTPRIASRLLENRALAEKAMGAAAEVLEKSRDRVEARQSLAHQKRAERALEAVADALSRALTNDQGNVVQRLGAGENELRALAHRQRQLLMETARVDRQRRWNRPAGQWLRKLASEEVAIERALARMEGLFGDGMDAIRRGKMRTTQDALSSIQQMLLKGETGTQVQDLQLQVARALEQLAEALEGDQRLDTGGETGGEGINGATPSETDGRLVEHGPPMNQVPEQRKGREARSGRERIGPSKEQPFEATPTSRIFLPKDFWSAIERFLTRKEGGD